MASHYDGFLRHAERCGYMRQRKAHDALSELVAHTHANTLTDPGHTHSGSVGSQGTIQTGAGGQPGLGGNNTGVVNGTITINSNTTGITINNASQGGGNPMPILNPVSLGRRAIKYWELRFEKTEGLFVSMNQDLERSYGAIAPGKPTDGPQLALAKIAARVVIGQHGAAAAAPAIEYARNLSQGISGRSLAQKSRSQPGVLGATRRWISRG
jgi:hypothetical protein